jgi:KDO2-lipid IV(A) lauroyltransferase
MRRATVDAAMRRGRLRFAQGQIFSRTERALPLVRAIRRGHAFFNLPDMDFGRKESVFVPFFGIPAATLTAPARLAATTDGQVIPVVTRLLPHYRGWEVRFFPPWEAYPGDDIEAATRRMNAFIEDRIRESPAEYFWSHKRFKTRPEGMPSVYDGQ